jgi:hypothetical protein
VQIRSKVSKSTLSDANEVRNWLIYADFAQHLIRITRKLYQKDQLLVDVEQAVYALDATTIDLCLSVRVSSYVCAVVIIDRSGKITHGGLDGALQ